MGKQTEVSMKMNASPDAVYRLVSDLPRMGEWSPECERCVWLGGATEAKPGARFRGHNRLGWRRWSTTGTIVVADPGREVVFDVDVGPVPIARWGYRIEPDGKGCVVTESFDDRRNPAISILGGVLAGVADRVAHNRAGMEKTLQRIKAEAETEGATSSTT